MNITLCQLRPRLGDIQHNLQLAVTEIEKTPDNIIVFPELFLSGYPPTDELGFSDVSDEITAAISQLKVLSKSISGLIIIGTPYFDGHHWRNAGLAIAGGEIIHRHYKVCLPNYDVFNDARYFVSGTQAAVFSWNNQKIAVLICEDIWADVNKMNYSMDPVNALNDQDVGIVFHLTASPFEVDKRQQRLAQLKRVALALNAQVVSVNQVGGYADILFDGQSMVVESSGELMATFPAFESRSYAIEDQSISITDVDSPEHQMIKAISFGLNEYMAQSGFSSVLVGLSGGIDSAVVAALAVHAIGKDKVTLVTLPTRFNSNETKHDAIDMANRLGCELIQLPIETYRTMMEADISLGVNANELNDIAKQNIQARLRGLILMAISNETGALLLTTGNKSELAMGYATLYGDMCGGLNIIGDCFKTEVFKMAHVLNEQHDWIPAGIINRPPSAELAPNQKDEDSLPPYDTLDQILIQRMQHGFSLNQLLQMNDKQDVVLVLDRLRKNEFKRFQSPPILKLSSKSFGRGWQFPLVR